MMNKNIHARTNIIIAIDGPAASGKGTLARRLAEHLNYFYLDTGKIYRLVGARAYHANLDIDNDEDKIIEIARNLAHEFDMTMMDNPELKMDHIGQMASKVASLPLVRIAVLDVQRTLAHTPPDGFNGAVLDGRDCGTVICPDATHKFFITADTETRAQRRFEELKSNGDTTSLKDVLREMMVRDDRDTNRDTAPLKPANDAVTIDTSTMSADDAFEKVLKQLG